MAKCLNCGRRGFFLKVNDERCCKKCYENNVVEKELDFQAQCSRIKIGEDIIGGTPTDFLKNDYYVYAWKIRDSGEVFYIGKGRGDRAYTKHDRAYEAEKIKQQYDTVVEILKDNLSETEALEFETAEITRILNHTNYRLTNRIIPFSTKRDNGYGKSPTTPSYKFETAPVLYASEIEEHYFNTKHLNFDEVDIECLGKVFFIEKSSLEEEYRVVYGGNFQSYLSDVKQWLQQLNSKVLRSQYAKSITAWIYLSDDYVTNYELKQQKAIDELGRRIPCYHLIDVWKFLKDLELDKSNNLSVEHFQLKSEYSRVPLEEIKNKDDFSKAFDLGFPLYEKGEECRKQGKLDEAIALFDEARSLGYDAPALYNAYAKAFRKAKNYEDEILILQEAIFRNSREDKIASWQLRIDKAKELLLKHKMK